MLDQPNGDREQRIIEVTRNSHHATEQAWGWFQYLDQRLHFPFLATWHRQGKGQTVEVIGMAAIATDTCEMAVTVRYNDESENKSEPDAFVVPLIEIDPIAPDAETAEAIADWHYWCAIQDTQD